jgi:hypothetical protein
VDVLGSLKDPCKAGSPDKIIGTNGEILTPRTSSLVLGGQYLSINCFKRSHEIQHIHFYKLELTECSVISVRELSHSGVRSYAQDHIKITGFIVELATVALARYFQASVVLYSSRNIYLHILCNLSTALTIA